MKTHPEYIFKIRMIELMNFARDWNSRQSFYDWKLNKKLCRRKCFEKSADNIAH